MSASNRKGSTATPKATSLTRRGARAAKKSIVTLGDLINAACEVGGSADAAAVLLSPLSPLSRMLGRRIVIA